MAQSEIMNVVKTWTNLFQTLEKEALEENKPYKYLQIFENKGCLLYTSRCV